MKTLQSIRGLAAPLSAFATADARRKNPACVCGERESATTALVRHGALQIEKDGRLRSKRVVQSSGRASFDRSVQCAAENTDLPATHAPLGVRTVTLTFNSQEKS